MTDTDLLYGTHAVNAALKKAKRKLLAIFVQQGSAEKRHSAIIDIARAQYHIPVNIVSGSELDKLCLHQNHQGIIAKATKLPVIAEKDLSNFINNIEPPVFFLILDGVTDPHNLGACMRSADAAGVQAVIIPKDNSASLNTTVCKVASGATEAIPIISVTNLTRTLDLLKEKNIWLYGAAENAEKTIWQMDFRGNIALILGAEGKGLRRLTKESCDGLFSIPMQGEVASLNVSVAAGISLFEACRQNLLIK
mgnify:CR=1 FL=1